MWFEHQNLSAMMGVQATSGKRKLEVVTGCNSAEIQPLVGETPCKNPRWENSTPHNEQIIQTGPTGDDCLERLRMVAASTPDVDSWRPATTIIGRVEDDSTLADDDDDWDDELSDYEELVGACSGPGRPQTPMWPVQNYWGPQSTYWSQTHQQTIRREENGKSYLELGASINHNRPQNAQCYRQRRLAVLNLSMCKLARYRQCSDPSLRRSVLICNTLRHIEREMENEGQTQGVNNHNNHNQQQQHNHHHHHHHNGHQPQQQQQQVQNQTSPQWYQPPENDYLRESGRMTPFPNQNPQNQTIGSETPQSVDSGYSDYDSDRTNINWGSVLSLTAHAGLTSLDEPLNNNLELYQELGLTPPNSDFAITPQMNNQLLQNHHGNDSWDSFVQVLVTGT